MPVWTCGVNTRRQEACPTPTARVARSDAAKAQRLPEDRYMRLLLMSAYHCEHILKGPDPTKSIVVDLVANIVARSDRQGTSRSKSCSRCSPITSSGRFTFHAWKRLLSKFAFSIPRPDHILPGVPRMWSATAATAPTRNNFAGQRYRCVGSGDACPSLVCSSAPGFGVAEARVSGD